MYKLLSNTLRKLPKSLKLAAPVSGCAAAHVHSPHAQRLINTSAVVAQCGFEFTKENQLRVDAILSFYPEEERRGALVPLLELAQRQHGWLPMSAMQKVAEMLNVDPFAVFEVVDFYFMLRRKPSGKYRTCVCVSPSCVLRGSEKILENLEKQLGIKAGETTKDMKFTLMGDACFGACVNAPVMSVNDDFYEDLTEKDATAIIDQLKKDVLPPPGPRSGRFASEPLKGLTTLTSPPNPAGFKMQKLSGDDDDDDSC